MRAVFALAALVAGCGGSTSGHRDAGRDADAATDADAGTDAGADAGGPASDPYGCADLYDEDWLPVFEIEIGPEEWAGLEAEFADPAGREAAGLDLKPYHPLVTFRLGDEVVDDAMIRLKGNPYFSWVPPKMQFVISFNEIDPGGRFHGLRKVSLDAPWYDPSLLHERLALSVMRELGLPAQCGNSARLVVNGELYGLFTNQEYIDKELLERVFGDEEAGGDLYKYGWDLRTNEETSDQARMQEFWATSDVPTLETVGDLEQWVAEWAAEAMLPDGDGYACCSHNFYTYDHPRRGFLFLPSDLDFTFDGGNGLGPMSPEVGPFAHSWGQVQHFDAVVADPTWRARYVEALRAARNVYDVATLDDRVTRWAEQIEDSVRDDPHRPFSFLTHQFNVNALHAFLQPRADFIDRWLACDGAADGEEDSDLDGWNWCRECNDADPAVSPAGIEACNWVDDDCDGRYDETDRCCTEAWFGVTRYSLCNFARTWQEAADFCVSQGGWLGAPPDAEEQAALYATASWLAWDDWWLGPNDRAVEGEFIGSDDAPLSYSGFPEWLPDGGEGEDCVVLDISLAAWNDRPCEERHPSVCMLPQ